jgi:amylosucrase
VHRPARDAARHAQRHTPASSAGQIYEGLRRLISLRSASPALAGTDLIGFRSRNASVLGYTRPSATGSVLVLANFSEHMQTVQASVLSALPAHSINLLDGTRRDLRADLSLAPYQMVWLDITGQRS